MQIGQQRGGRICRHCYGSVLHLSSTSQFTKITEISVWSSEAVHYIQSSHCSHCSRGSSCGQQGRLTLPVPLPDPPYLCSDPKTCCPDPPSQLSAAWDSALSASVTASKSALPASVTASDSATFPVTNCAGSEWERPSHGAFWHCPCDFSSTCSHRCDASHQGFHSRPRATPLEARNVSHSSGFIRQGFA